MTGKDTDGSNFRTRLEVSGIVQGVGFRPWVFQLAQANGLHGFVLNSTLGVVIEVEGPAGARDRFLTQFHAHPPPLAMIDEVHATNLPAAGYTAFLVKESVHAGGEFVLVPPDISTCPECLADVRDPANRRFGYPFTNCTNCGPRYTIIRDIPYDRPKTTMALFAMCPECEREYHDPANRRFHAEPNACPACGPSVELWDHQAMRSVREQAIAETRRLLREGRILAIKGLGGFHLACDATNDKAVRLLRERKRRSGKPFAVMAANLETVRRFALLSAEEEAAITSMRRPIVLLQRAGTPLSTAVAPGNRTVGVMLPYTPLHYLLFTGESPQALVMTSANLSEEPIASLNEEVPSRLHPLADFFLLHNRDIHVRVDDSVVQVSGGRERLLRRARAFAPHPIDLGFPVLPLLACGGELKNTLCLTREHYAILSQHIGDMENFETMQVFEETLRHLQRFFRVEPVAVVHDLHPHYLTTRIAQAMEGIPKIGVQHHHAHIAACMAENRLDGKVIGVALDGTGFGTDGKVWGGEILVAGYAAFERRAHFRNVLLCGGDTAIRHPWRMALSYLHDTGLPAPPALHAVAADSRRVVEQMLALRMNCVETSSCGRLFDAASALLGICLEATYEGQPAIELEHLAAAGVEDFYPFELNEGVIDFRETIRTLLRDHDPIPLAAARFHNTIARAVTAACLCIHKEDRLNRVCLSGGTLQNKYLAQRLETLLQQAGLKVFTHSKVPPNDGGLALGQAVIANSFLRD